MSAGERLLVANLRAVAPRWGFPLWAEARLRDEAPSGWRAHIVSTPTVSDGDGGAPPSAELLDAIAGAEAYAGFGIPRELFLAAPKLRWVHSAAAGVGSALFPEMLASEVVLTNSAGVHAAPIAEHVLAGVLFFLRSLDVAADLQRAGVWDREPFVGEESTVTELSDCRALILGAGGIGSEIARRLSALGCACTGVRRRPELGAPAGFDRVVGVGEWREFLGGSNLLIVTAPATPETTHLVTEREVGRLPSGGILVNVSRGTIVDEGAVAAALREGRLRGAVLDVFAREPLEPHSPLWRMPNVLITPHVSGVTSGRFWDRQMELLMDNWHRWASGRELRNVVDKDAGY